MHYRSSSRNSRYLRARRRRKHKKLMLLAAVLLCIFLFLYALIQLIGYIANSISTHQSNQQLQNLYENAYVPEGETAVIPVESTPTSPPSAESAPAPAPAQLPGLLEEYQWLKGDVLPEMYTLYSENNDTIAWIKISGVVNLPVVYRDNTYYLNHTFYGKTSSSGTLFLDANTPFTPRTQHLVIHGHNMHDGSMFGQISHYRRADYTREHSIVYFSTLCRKEVYVVFAVLVVPDSPGREGFVPYNSYPNFANAEQCYAFLDLVRSQSLHNIPIDVNASDALLTLSTCLEDDRVVVFCRRLRADESEASVYAALLGNSTQSAAQN